MPKSFNQVLSEYTTDEEKAAKALNDLKSLTKNDGWKMIKKMISNDIENLEERLLDPDNDLSEKKRARFRDKRINLKFLKHLPEELIKTLQGKDTDFIELDPYEKPEPEEEE